MFRREAFGDPGALSGVTRCCGGDLLKKRRIALRLRARGLPALWTRCLGHLLKRRMLGTAARAPRPGRIYEMAPAHGCPERFRRRYNLAQRLLCDAAARTPHRTGRARAPSLSPLRPLERSGGALPAREDACARALSSSSAHGDGGFCSNGIPPSSSPRNRLLHRRFPAESNGPGPHLTSRRSTIGWDGRLLCHREDAPQCVGAVLK